MKGKSNGTGEGQKPEGSVVNLTERTGNKVLPLKKKRKLDDMMFCNRCDFETLSINVKPDDLGCPECNGSLERYADTDTYLDLLDTLRVVCQKEEVGASVLILDTGHRVIVANKGRSNGVVAALETVKHKIITQGLDDVGTWSPITKDDL